MLVDTGRTQRQSADSHAIIHFLHIGKNAGTQIKYVAKCFNEYSSDFRIQCYGHGKKLRALPDDALYFFSVRQPVSRFYSGFYSRQRKGLPRYFCDWSAHEEIAFNEFTNANALAESLFQDGATGAKAYRAMFSIRHVATHQHSWFGKLGHFLELHPPVHIIRRENFDADLAVFLKKASFAGNLCTSKDARVSHKNNYGGEHALSQLAIKNLERWYTADIEFYKMCCEWIECHSKV